MMSKVLSTVLNIQGMTLNKNIISSKSKFCEHSGKKRRREIMESKKTKRKQWQLKSKQGK